MTNLPHLIMQNDRLTAINNTTQMDLQGQAASESSGHRHISGTGGQLQFVRGAYASNGGKSFICMSSTYERTGVRKSRIVLDLTPGNVVTAPRSDMMYVVTEYGMVNLKGKSVPERAKAMISIAHPDFRDDLEREARENGLIPRSFCEPVVVNAGDRDVAVVTGGAGAIGAAVCHRLAAAGRTRGGRRSRRGRGAATSRRA